MTFRHY